MLFGSSGNHGSSLPPPPLLSHHPPVNHNDECVDYTGGNSGAGEVVSHGPPPLECKVNNGIAAPPDDDGAGPGDCDPVDPNSHHGDGRDMEGRSHDGGDYVGTTMHHEDYAGAGNVSEYTVNLMNEYRKA